MIIDIIRLKSGVVDKINIDEVISISKEQLENTGILELNEVNVVGNIIKNNIDEYILNVRVYGKMILPCSVSLKPTEYPFDFEIDGNIQELLEEIGENEKNLENTIDIFQIIWENILMEIPIRVVNENVHDIKLEGEGWQFVTGERKTVNPELEKLKDLLKWKERC